MSNDIPLANCLWCWQLRKDSGHAEAAEHLNQLQPIQRSIHEARVLMERNQYEQAVQMLAHPIEVWKNCDQIIHAGISMVYYVNFCY